ncbi:MAG: methyltransferase domain-containing protein [Betaproteobacteria bacterium]|nr:methyltransferase domain-containing protein [Betaproteobacteria bacterium]
MGYGAATGAAAPRLGGAFLIACLAAVLAFAQEKDLDTPYVQTPQNVVDKMLEIAKVRSDDYVIDLGSGDGRMVITAAKKHGARGFGVDLDRRLVKLSNTNAAKAGVANRAAFYARDLFDTDVSRATVLTIYLLPDVNLAIRARLLATLKPGTRIVSHDYDMGEWPPDFQMELAAPGKTVGVGQRSKIFYWMVPGRAAGRWRWSLTLDGKTEEFELALDQNFQMIEGKLNTGGRSARVERAALEGEQVRFAATTGTGAAQTRYEFSGRIINHAIEGSVRVTRGARARELPWSAARTELWDPRHVGLPTAPGAAR